MSAFSGVLFIVLLENPKFATESTQTPPRKLTIKKNFKFSTSEFTKLRHFRSQNKKFAPSQTPPPVERGCSRWGGVLPHPFGASSPQLWTRVDATACRAFCISSVMKLDHDFWPNTRPDPIAFYLVIWPGQNRWPSDGLGPVTRFHLWFVYLNRRICISLYIQSYHLYETTNQSRACCNTFSFVLSRPISTKPVVSIV